MSIRITCKDQQEYTAKHRYLLGHGWSSHITFSVEYPVQVPPLDSWTSLARVLILVPTPHVAEQEPSVHSSQTQWTAEIRCCSLGDDNITSCQIWLITFHILCLDTKLWITYTIDKGFIPGHTWMLQPSWIEAGPLHSSPPYAAKTFSVLVLVLVPSPHVAEHVPIVQSFHWQSTEIELRSNTKTV